MIARNKYIVIHSEDYMRWSAGTSEASREVYADQITMTPGGDVVFHQVRDSAIVDDHGQRLMRKDMAIVLMLKSNAFSSIYLAAPNSLSECYRESGQIKVIN